jgi:hypothetical protein
MLRSFSFISRFLSTETDKRKFEFSPTPSIVSPDKRCKVQADVSSTGPQPAWHNIDITKQVERIHQNETTQTCAIINVESNPQSLDVDETSTDEEIETVSVAQKHHCNWNYGTVAG